jgi:hypothetical protein
LTFALLLANPIALLAHLDGKRYFGYVAPNVWHNPTIVLLKPFALLLFLWATSAFFKHAHAPRWGIVAVMAITTVMSALAKPSQLICLVPGTALFALLQSIRGKPISWSMLALGLWLPACLVLIGQYVMTYAGEGQAGLAFGPLVFWRRHSEYLFPKFLLSIIFPVLVYALFARDASRDTGLNLAWIVFGCSLLWAYLIIEKRQPGSGNLTWSAQVALFVLFCTSTRFLVQRTWSWLDWSPPRRALRSLVAWLALACHVYFGVGYYVHIMRTPSQYCCW